MSRFIFRTPKPTVAPEDPSGGFLLELLITNGAPFKDHWAYWVRSHDDPDIGVKIHATGDVRNGFEFEIKRSENLRTTEDIPTTRVPLQWLDVQHFDERAMLNDGKYVIHQTPVCQFESIVYKVKAPGKSLNSVDGKVSMQQYTFEYWADSGGLGDTRKKNHSERLPNMDCGVRPTALRGQNTGEMCCGLPKRD
jgi:hypothetical protein